MSGTGKLKCKYCDYTTGLWRQHKNGRRTSGWVTLADHIRHEHPEHEREADNLVYDCGPGRRN